MGIYHSSLPLATMSGYHGYQIKAHYTCQVGNQVLDGVVLEHMHASCTGTHPARVLNEVLV